MSHKQSDQQILYFLSLRHSKQFHIIDSPAITFSLAEKNDFKMPQILNQLHEQKQNNYIKSEGQKPKNRFFYKNIKTKLFQLLKSIYKGLQNEKFSFSQFFDYEQLVISGFIKSFVAQTTQQCKEKGQFLDYLWIQTMKLMKYILQQLINKNTSLQKQKNNELCSVHRNYGNFIENQANRVKQQLKEISNLKKVLEVLIQKSRLKAKEVKKLSNIIEQLLLIFDKVRDKNSEVQVKYLDLIQKALESTKRQKQIKQFTIIKKQYNFLFDQISNIEDYLCKNIKQPNVNVKLEKPLLIQQFMAEAAKLFSRSKVLTEEIKIDITPLFQKLSWDQQEPLVKFVAGQGNRFHGDKNHPLLNQINNRIASQKSQLVSYGTQTTHTGDIKTPIPKTFKKHLGRINTLNMGVDRNSTPREDKSFQCNIQEQGIQKKKKALQIEQTTQFLFSQQNYDKSEIMLNQAIAGSKKTNHSLKTQKENLSYYNISTYNQNVSLYNIEKRSQSKSALSKKSKSKKQKMTNNFQNIKNRYSSMANSPKKASIVRRSQNASSKIQLIPKISSNINEASVKHIRRAMSISNSKIQHSDKINQNTSTISKFSKEQPTSQFTALTDNKTKFSQENKKKGFVSFKCFSAFEEEDEEDDIKANNNSDKEIENEGKRKLIRSKTNISQMKGYLDIFEDVKSLNQDSSNLKQKGIKGVINEVLTKKNRTKRKIMISCAAEDNYEYSKQLKQNLMGKVLQFELKPRKIEVLINQRHIYNIISSVYAKTSHKINAGETVQNLLSPLSQSMLMLYGNIEKQQLSKKIFNFIFLINSQKQDQLCKSFIFLLGMDLENKNSQYVSSCDIHLYLKLLPSLSHMSNPLIDASQATTDLNKVKEGLPKLLNEQMISGDFAKVIIDKLQQILINLNNNDNGALIIEKKLNLFYCCKLIIEYVIQAKLNIKENFISYFRLFAQQNEKVEMNVFQNMIRNIGLTNVEILAVLTKISSKKKKRESRFFGINQLTEFLLKIGIHTFEEYYVRILRKFNINSMEKKNYLTGYKLALDYSIFPTKEAEVIDSQKQAIQDILALNYVERSASALLEDIIGKQLGILFSYSIVVLSQI